MRYKLFKGNLYNNDVVRESNDENELIGAAQKSKDAMTVVSYFGEIIFENEAQEKINNRLD